MNDLVPVENNLVSGNVVTPMQLAEQVKMIREAMKSVMVEGVHYGKIPGCGDKDGLLQPGGQKLGLMFNLGPEYRITRTDLQGGHREYEVVTVLKHRATGRFIGEGVGTCSTMESKYRYRWENTKQLVPKEYWETRNRDLLGGSTFVARKAWNPDDKDDKKQHWYIFQRVDHDNPADYYNTVIKIGKKRSFQDGIITATASGDLFVPDDELPEEFMQGDVDTGGGEAPIREPQRRSTGNGEAPQTGAINEGQTKTVRAALKRAEISDTELCKKFEILKVEDLPFAKLNDALDWIKNPS